MDNWIILFFIVLLLLKSIAYYKIKEGICQFTFSFDTLFYSLLKTILLDFVYYLFDSHVSLLLLLKFVILDLLESCHNKLLIHVLPQYLPLFLGKKYNDNNDLILNLHEILPYHPFGYSPLINWYNF